jgi:hypothetical protein
MRVGQAPKLRYLPSRPDADQFRKADS